MFYCELCRAERYWPKSPVHSDAQCENCGQRATCYDVPSSRLPMIPEGMKPHPDFFVRPGAECVMLTREQAGDSPTVRALVDAATKANILANYHPVEDELIYGA